MAAAPFCDTPLEVAIAVVRALLDAAVEVRVETTEPLEAIVSVASCVRNGRPVETGGASTAGSGQPSNA